MIYNNLELSIKKGDGIPDDVSDRKQRLWICFAIKSATHTALEVEVEVEVEVEDDDDGNRSVGGVFLGPGPEALSLDSSNPIRKSKPFGDVIC